MDQKTKLENASERFLQIGFHSVFGSVGMFGASVFGGIALGSVAKVLDTPLSSEVFTKVSAIVGVSTIAGVLVGAGLMTAALISSKLANEAKEQDDRIVPEIARDMVANSISNMIASPKKVVDVISNMRPGLGAKNKIS